MLRPDFTFHHTIVIEDWVERGVSGEVYKPPVTYKCRVNLKAEHSHQMSGMPSNENIVSGTVFMSAGVRMPPLSRATFQGRKYKVITCQPCYDAITGAENHVEVELR